MCPMIFSNPGRTDVLLVGRQGIELRGAVLPYDSGVPLLLHITPPNIDPSFANNTYKSCLRDLIVSDDFGVISF
jgi:hypothetical protein